MPAEAHALANLMRLDFGADRRDRANDLMSGNKRELADAPVIGDEVNIAMANAAVGNSNLHFLRAQLTRVIAIWEQFCSSRVRCKSLNLGHSRSEFLVGVGGRPAGSQTCAVPQSGAYEFLL